MTPQRIVTGRACPLDRADVDTDQIVPKQFLKRIQRTGFGPFAFYGWRYDEAGEPRADFPLNRPEHAGAAILVTGANFGCGSSREHAPWALQDAGFQAIVAPSFADIFTSNCAKIGLITAAVPTDTIRALLDLISADPSVQVTVDLEQQVVHSSGLHTRFEIDPHTRHCILEGLDDVDLTLQHIGAIAEFEAKRPSHLPVVR